MSSSTSAILITWRLLALDPATISFNVYRSANAGVPIKLNTSPITSSTNFRDSTADLTADNSYTVRPILDGVEQTASSAFVLTANHTAEPIVRVALQPIPSTGYYTKYVWVGDLDGDGEYDFVIDRLAPFDPTNDDIGLGHQYLEAYKRDGTRLWQIDLGPLSTGTYNIHPSASTLSMGMYDGATVYDLDGDGKAEVILKIADGVKFPDGTTFSDSDPQMQYIAVLDGKTGNLKAKAPFPTDFLTAGGALGTQLGIGYSDGVTPSIYFWGRNRNKDKSFNDVFVSWSWDGASTIKANWKFTTTEKDAVVKQASHQMRIIDLDGDGKDELMTGNFAINSDGTLRYAMDGVLHGDRFYIGKLDPSSPDGEMQGYGIQQNNPSGLLEYYYNASTGKIQWSYSTTPGDLIDVGRGLVGDVDPRYPGYEVWSFYGLKNGPTSARTEASDLQPYASHTLWWEAGVTSQTLVDTMVRTWHPDNPSYTGRPVTLSHYGGVIHGHNPMFFGDILGDWRTEIIAMNSDFSQLLIFSSDIETTQRFYTMAQNPAYRNHMTLKGYMQSPLLDYYFGAGMSTPPIPNIRYAGSGRIQAESGLVTGGAVVASSQAGYAGSGYVDFQGSSGTVSLPTIDGGDGGKKTVSIRYSNGSSGALGGVLTVNGISQAVTFPATGSWANWQALNVELSLAAGLANKVSIGAGTGGTADIDEVAIP